MNIQIVSWRLVFQCGTFHETIAWKPIMVRIRYVYSRGEIVKNALPFIYHLESAVTNWLHLIRMEGHANRSTLLNAHRY